MRARTAVHQDVHQLQDAPQISQSSSEVKKEEKLEPTRMSINRQMGKL